VYDTTPLLADNCIRFWTFVAASSYLRQVTKWMAEILFSFDVCLCVSVRSGPVNQTSLKRFLKLRTSNLTCLFRSTVQTWPLKNFSKRSVCKNSLCGNMLFQAPSFDSALASVGHMSACCVFVWPQCCSVLGTHSRCVHVHWVVGDACRTSWKPITRPPAPWRHRRLARKLPVSRHYWCFVRGAICTENVRKVSGRNY